jgi:hypothetical protein
MRFPKAVLVVLAAALLPACQTAYADSPPPPAGQVARPPSRPWWPAPEPARARARLELTSASGARLPTFYHQGRTYVLGELGERYSVRVVNPTSVRVEAVVSIDGLDAIDGKPASYAKRGYVLPPYGDVVIEGFRTSLSDVATFRFSSVSDSYADRKGVGRNVGVIGVALFRERERPPVIAQPRPPMPRSWDGDHAEAPSARKAPSSSAAPRRDKAEAAPGMGQSRERSGLGTEYGEERWSPVNQTSFERMSSSPFAVSELRYDDRAGLRARGIRLEPPREPELDRRDQADPFPAGRFAEPPP